MKTIAICNLKGGVGKTTTALNLGAVQLRQAVREIAPPTEEAAPPPDKTQVWQPYPAARPVEGQLVLTKSHSKYNRDNYAVYIYRAEGWYLPELPDDGLMTVDVRWWTAELPPENRGAGS